MFFTNCLNSFKVLNPDALSSLDDLTRRAHPRGKALVETRKNAEVLLAQSFGDITLTLRRPTELLFLGLTEIRKGRANTEYRLETPMMS